MCLAVKRTLDSKGFEYTTKAIEDQPSEWLEEQKAAGYLQAPITVVDHPSGGSITISGFRPDLLEKLEDK